ncbi:MAG: hypothetical protein ABH827_00770, partial [bacterium]
MMFKKFKFKIFLFSALVFCQLGFVNASQRIIGGELVGKIVSDTGKVVDSKDLGYDSPLKVTLRNGGVLDVKVNVPNQSSQVNIVYPDEFVSLEANSQDSKIQRIPMGDVTEDPLDQISDSQTNLSISKTNNDVGVNLQNQVKVLDPIQKTIEKQIKKPLNSTIVCESIVKGSIAKEQQKQDQFVMQQNGTGRRMDAFYQSEPDEYRREAENKSPIEREIEKIEYEFGSSPESMELSKILSREGINLPDDSPITTKDGKPAWRPLQELNLNRALRRGDPRYKAAFMSYLLRISKANNDYSLLVKILHEDSQHLRAIKTEKKVNSDQNATVVPSVSMAQNANVEGMGGGVVLRDGVVPGGSLSEPGILKQPGMVEPRGFGGKMYDGMKYLGEKVVSFGKGALELGGKVLDSVSETLSPVVEKMGRVLGVTAKEMAKEAFVNVSVELVSDMVFGAPSNPSIPVDPCGSQSRNPCGQGMSPCDRFSRDPCSSPLCYFGSSRPSPVFDESIRRQLEERLASGRNNQNNNQNFQNNNQQRDLGDQNNRKRKFDAPNGPGRSEEDEREAKRRKTFDSKQFKGQIATLNKLNAQYQQQGGNNSDIKNSGQVVEICNKFAEFFADSDDTEMAEHTANFSVNMLLNSRAFLEKLKQSETQVVKEFFTKEHFQQQIIGMLDTCVYLMNELAEEDAIQQTFDISKLDEHARKQHEAGMALHRDINQHFDQLRNMSWEDRTIAAARLGTMFFLDGLALNAFGKFTSSVARGFKIGVAKSHQLLSVELPKLTKALEQLNPLNKNIFEEVAGIGKMRLEHGPEVMQKTLET